MRKNIFLGIDIGATKTIFLLVKINGAKYKILESVKISTPRKEKEILKKVEDCFIKLSAKNKISAIGIGFCGPVDFERGRALAGPNLKTGKIEFKKILERKLKVPVAVDNDARCFALAENVFGAAMGYKNIVGLTIGTGIGGGIIIDGKIYRGATGSTGEFGHTNIEVQGELEQTSSGRGICKVYKRLAGKEKSSFEIVKLAEQKDALAIKVIQITAKNLGVGIANIIEFLNPETIVLGGGLADVDLIINKAKEYAKKKVFLSSLAKTPVVVSKLGQNAAALGAAWMAKKI